MNFFDPVEILDFEESENFSSELCKLIFEESSIELIG